MFLGNWSANPVYSVYPSDSKISVPPWMFSQGALLAIPFWTKISLAQGMVLHIGSLYQSCRQEVWLSYYRDDFRIIQGAIKKREKSNHLFWCKNRVKFLFLAQYLWGNISPFNFIIFTTLWCHLFWSKFSIQKMLKYAKKCPKLPFLAHFG